MGLQAYFYDNQTAENTYNDSPPIPPDTPMVFSIPVATVDQDFDLYPMAGLTEDFVVKYEGYITATESGTANLQCLADDGCIVIIDGSTIINEWWDKGTSGDVYQYTLVPNQSLPFTVWYYENGGGAVVQLRWQLENQDWAVVPESVFSTMPKLITTIDGPNETQTPQVVETYTSSSETETTVSQPVVEPLPVDTQTPTNDSETSTVLSGETQTSTSESSTQTIPTETSTAPIETPLPTPSPVVVQLEPVRPTPILVLEPQPESQPQVEPEPLPEEIDEEAPLEEPTEQEPVVEEPLPVDEPSEYLEEEDTNEILIEDEIVEQTELNPEPLPQPSVEPEPTFVPEIAPVTPIVSEPMVTLDNGVVLTEEEAVAIVLLQNPTELLAELFTDPGAVLTALGSVGADMTPEVREKSEKVVVSAIIAGGIATQSAAAAAGAAAYRRKQ